jgi:hypothetical protein
MSWEAVTWANKQRMKSPQEQLVLLMLANCADPGGVAFAQWKGRDHWWHYLADRTRLSRASLFRHLNTIEQVGLGSRSTLVMSDGTKRPIIQLDFAAVYDVEIVETQSHGETDDDDAQSHGENGNDLNHLQEGDGEGAAQSHHETENRPAQSHGETGAEPAKSHHETKPVSVVRLHIDSNSIPISPPTPRAGGELAVDQDWEEFKKTWREPMQRPSLVQSVWDHIPTGRRGEAVTAARGYWTWIGKQPKPPSAVSAQTFLREIGGWSQWLPWAGPAGSTPSTSLAYPRDTVEAKALTVLHDIAGVAGFFRQVHCRSDGTVSYAKPVTPRLAALAHAGPQADWPTLTRQQGWAWEMMLRETVSVQVRKHPKEGDRAPWPWPPSVDGKIYSADTGPPLMTEQDLAEDFK